MTKKTQDSKNKPETTTTSNYDPAAMFQSFMSNFSDTSTVSTNPAAGWMEMNQQWMNFLGERFKKDSALLEKLSKCKDPAEISAAHMGFYTEATEDYQREFAEMTELGQQAIGQNPNVSQAGVDQTQTKKD